MQIVLVDASPMVLRTVKAQPEARGRRVETATHGLEALALVGNNPNVDTVITGIDRSNSWVKYGFAVQEAVHAGAGQ